MKCIVKKRIIYKETKFRLTSTTLDARRKKTINRNMGNHLEVKHSYSLKSYWGLLLLPTRIIYTALALIPYIRNLEKNMNQLFPDSVGEYNKRKKKLVEPYDHSGFQPESTFQDEKQREEPQKIIVALIWFEKKEKRVRQRWLEVLGYGIKEKRNMQIKRYKNLSSLSFCRMLSFTCK